MQTFLEFIGILFQIIKTLLIAAAILWGFPSLFLMIQDEREPRRTNITPKTTKARHLRAPGATNDRMKQRVAEFREMKNNKSYHGRRRTGWFGYAAA